MKNALIFSQSDVPNFFMFIILIYIKGSRVEKKEKIEMLRGLLENHRACKALLIQSFLFLFPFFMKTFVNWKFFSKLSMVLHFVE